MITDFGNYLWRLFSFTSKWSHIINQCLKYATQEVKQYKELTADFEKQKHLYYQGIYLQGYSNGHASRRCWK